MIDGPRLKQLREAHKLSQHQLAKLSGISPQQISRWESGQRGSDPGFGTVLRLADALGSPPWEFMQGGTAIEGLFKVWAGGRPTITAQAEAG